METGSRTGVVHEGGERLARGMGVDLLGLRVGYASIGITLGSGGNSITRMVSVDRHGVNQRLNHAVRRLVRDAAAGRLQLSDINARLAALEAFAPRYPAWFVALAVGLACAAFGELLGIDTPAFLAVLFAGTAGQAARQALQRTDINFYVGAAIVGALTASLGGLGAQLAGSATVELAMVASTLLLVPGVAATNAQADIMDGYPTMGSARAVSLIMTMAFVTIGLWLAQFLVGIPE
jgi:uncharacterized membrane protein YjjP (DUF1212 family)